MSLREHYDLLELLAPHRVPRCPTCRLILPCRQDGAYGPCDARELTTEAYDNVCKLLQVVFDRAGEVARKAAHARKLALMRDEYAAKAKRDGKVLMVDRTHCKNGHEMTGNNVGESTCGGEYKKWCRACKNEQKRQFRRRMNDQAGQSQNQRTSPGASETEPVHHVEQGEPNRVYGGQQGT